MGRFFTFWMKMFVALVFFRLYNDDFRYLHVQECIIVVRFLFLLRGVVSLSGGFFAFSGLSLFFVAGLVASLGVLDWLFLLCRLPLHSVYFLWYLEVARPADLIFRNLRVLPLSFRRRLNLFQMFLSCCVSHRFRCLRSPHLSLFGLDSYNLMRPKGASWDVVGRHAYFLCP